METRKPASFLLQRAGAADLPLSILYKPWRASCVWRREGQDGSCSSGHTLLHSSSPFTPSFSSATATTKGDGVGSRSPLPPLAAQASGAPLQRDRRRMTCAGADLRAAFFCCVACRPPLGTCLDNQPSIAAPPFLCTHASDIAARAADLWRKRRLHLRCCE